MLLPAYELLEALNMKQCFIILQKKNCKKIWSLKNIVLLLHRV